MLGTRLSVAEIGQTGEVVLVPSVHIVISTYAFLIASIN
jgi:hypothetical protein